MSKPIAIVVCESCGTKDKLVACDGFESKGYNCEDVYCENCSVWDKKQEVWRCGYCDDKHGRYKYCQVEHHEYNADQCDDECPNLPECCVCDRSIIPYDNAGPCAGECDNTVMCHSCATYDDVEKVYRCCDCEDEHLAKPTKAGQSK